LFDAGLIPDEARVTISEELTGRDPNTKERQLLNLPLGMVWDIARVFRVDGVPVEASRVIAPMAEVELRYETDVS
jgi:hypothetical protein